MQQTVNLNSLLTELNSLEPSKVGAISKEVIDRLLNLIDEIHKIESL
ncbi:hypothetical protein ACFU1R_05935 [Priestia megaterium]